MGLVTGKHYSFIFSTQTYPKYLVQRFYCQRSGYNPYVSILGCANWERKRNEKQKATSQVKAFLLCVAVLVVFVCVQQRREKLLVDGSGQQDVKSQRNRKQHRVNKPLAALLLVIRLMLSRKNIQDKIGLWTCILRNRCIRGGQVDQKIVKKTTTSRHCLSCSIIFIFCIVSVLMVEHQNFTDKYNIL